MQANIGEIICLCCGFNLILFYLPSDLSALLLSNWRDEDEPCLDGKEEAGVKLVHLL